MNGPWGAWAWGAAAPFDDSAGSALANLLATPTQRTWLLTAYPRTYPAGSEVEVRIADIGFWSQPTDTPANKLWHTGLQQPYAFKLDLMPNGKVVGIAPPRPGDVTIANPNGEFDYLLDLEWAGARMEVRLGDGSLEARAPYGSFGPVLIGNAAGITGSAVEIRIALEGALQALDEPHQDALYLGLGEALRMDGVDDHIDVAGDGFNVGSEQSFFLMVRFRADPGRAGQQEVLAAKRTTSTGWMLWLSTVGNLVFTTDDGVTGQNLTGSRDLRDGEIHSALAVLDRSGAVHFAKTYADGEAEAGPANRDGLGSLVNTHAFRAGARSDGALFFKGDMVELAFGFRPVSAEEVLAWLGRPLDAASDDCYVYDCNEALGAVLNCAPPELGLDVGLLCDGVDDLVLAPDDDSLDCQDADLPLRLRVAGGRTASSGDGYQTLAQKFFNYRLAYATDSVRLTYFSDDGTAYSWTWNGFGEMLVWHDFDATLFSLASNGCTLHVDGVDLGAADSYTATGGVGRNLNNGFSVGSDNSGAFQRRYGPTWLAQVWIAGVLVLDWPIDENTGGTVADLSGHGNDGTITGATWIDRHAAITGATWATSYEGPEVLVGKSKPFGYGGPIEETAPILLSAQLQIYQLHGGSMGGLLLLEDSGQALTPTTDTADLVTVAGLASDEYATDLARGLLRLGDKPAGKLTATWLGDNAGGWTGDRFEIIQRIALRCGLTEAQIDATSFAAAQAADVAGDVQIYTGLEVVHAAQLIGQLAEPDASVTADRLGILRVVVWEPPEDLVAIRTLTDDDVDLDGYRLLRSEDPTYLWRIGYARYYTTQDEGEVATGVSAARRQQLQETWRYAIYRDSALKAALPRAQTQTVPTQLTTRAAAVRMGIKMAALLGRPRRFESLGVPETTGLYFAGDPLATALSRYNLSNGKIIVTGVDEDSSGDVNFIVLR